MKRSRIEDINNRITQFYKEYVAIAREWKVKFLKERAHDWALEGWTQENIKRYVKNYQKLRHFLPCFQDEIANTFYHDKPHAKIRKDIEAAAAKCGFELAGAGRTRIALSIEYNSQTVVVKLAPNKKENIKEMKAMREVMDEGSDEMKSVVLTPTHFWTHRNWGVVAVFPSVRTFGGEWDCHWARREEWDRSGLPSEMWTEETVDRLDVIKSHFGDSHEYNIGFMNNVPYIIDVNFGWYW